jgi:hypothetical protein
MMLVDARRPQLRHLRAPRWWRYDVEIIAVCGPSRLDSIAEIAQERKSNPPQPHDFVQEYRVIILLFLSELAVGFELFEHDGHLSGR